MKALVRSCSHCARRQRGNLVDQLSERDSFVEGDSPWREQLRCVLHIGTEKTGTTFIQNCLHRNVEALRKEGFYVLKSFGAPNNWFIPAYFRQAPSDFWTWQGIRTQAEKDRFFQTFAKDFERELRAAEGCHTFLITSEHFHSRLLVADELRALKRFLSSYFDEIIVLCYFREQSQMAVSLYSTNVKLEATVDLATFIEDVNPSNYYFNFVAIADNWAGIFGLKNCKFRLYKDDIWNDFLDAIGTEPDRIYMTDVNVAKNESLSLLHATLFMAVNQRIGFWKEIDGRLVPNQANRRVKEALRKKVPSLGRVRCLAQGKIYEMFLEQNQVFFEKYIPGQLRFEPPNVEGADLSESVRPEQVAKIAVKVLEAVSDVYDTMEADLIAQRSYFARWVGEVDHYIHRIISSVRFLPPKIRARFRRIAWKKRARTP